MAILGYILLALLALVAAVLVALVCVPLQGRAAGVANDDRLNGVVMASWGFGLIGLYAATGRGGYLLLFGRPVRRLPEEDEEKRAEKRAKKLEKKRAKKAKKKKKGRKKSLAQRLAFWLDHNAILRGLLGRLLTTLQVRLQLHGTIGLDDPADTAAVVTALRTLGLVSEAVQVQVEPDYLEERLALAGEVSGRIWLLAMLWVAFCSLFEVRTWRLLRGLI